MYADDTVMYLPITANATNTEITLFQEDIGKITKWCKQNKLSINVKKTKIMVLGRKPRSAHNVITIKMNACELEFVNTYRYLGILLNVKLNLVEQSRQTLYTVTKKVNTLAHIRHYINCETAILIYKTNILPLFEYANICFTLIPRQYINKFQRVQNRVLRVIFYRNTDMTINELHNKARLAPLQLRASKQLLNLTYRRLTRPDQYPLVDQSEVITRSMTKIKFYRPLPRVERYKAFPFYAGVTLWDRLPMDLQHIDSYPLFKCKITEWLLSQNYIT